MLIVKNLRKPNGIYLRNPSLPRDEAGNPLSREQSLERNTVMAAKADADAKAKAKEGDAKNAKAKSE